MLTEANIQKIRSQLDAIRELYSGSPYTDAFRRWHRETEQVIADLCGDQSQYIQSFQAILFTPLFLSCRCGDTVFDEAYRDGIGAATDLLCRLLEHKTGKVSS